MIRRVWLQWSCNVLICPTIRGVQFDKTGGVVCFPIMLLVVLACPLCPLVVVHVSGDSLGGRSYLLTSFGAAKPRPKEHFSLIPRSVFSGCPRRFCGCCCFFRCVAPLRHCQLETLSLNYFRGCCTCVDRRFLSFHFANHLSPSFPVRLQF